MGRKQVVFFLTDTIFIWVSLVKTTFLIFPIESNYFPIVEHCELVSRY